MPQQPLLPEAARAELLNEFRNRFRRFLTSIHEAVLSSADTVVLWRLGDDLDQYIGLVNEYSSIFPPEELALIIRNLAIMQSDVRLQYEQAANESHHGRPEIVQVVHTGQQGRPQIHIDPEFLQWAYTMRSTSSIARFLGVGRTTVRDHLLAYGIAESREQPFMLSVQYAQEEVESPDFLDPQGQVFPLELPQRSVSPTLEPPQQSISPVTQTFISSYTGPLSDISDESLEDILIRLRRHFRRAGITMLDGMLRRLGHRVPRERIKQSLTRIDPVQRVFQRIQIRRRVYSVPGPNSLWHHDGQHGLIRWGIVIHGFIDGYSRLITALQAHNNNLSQTVLDLFLHACEEYGVPSRLRGDHGLENLYVAAWMETNQGQHRGSYIWGRSVHNVRIERLWVDVTAQVGATWADLFTLLEIQHGLNINSIHHIWLLHFLFLGTVNQQLNFFAQSWNHHRIQIRDGPNRSPADMFGFDMFIHGVRGSRLPQPQSEENLSQEELEVFGVDWEGLRDDRLLHAREANNLSDEAPGSWLGRSGPPEHLNEVPVNAPQGIFSPDELQYLDQSLLHLAGAVDNSDVVTLWIEGLALARIMYPQHF